MNVKNWIKKIKKNEWKKTKKNELKKMKKKWIKKEKISLDKMRICLEKRCENI